MGGRARRGSRRLGRRAQAPGLGPGHAVPRAGGALANAYQIHNSEFDCVHERAVVHAMTAVLAAALAQAERQGRARGRLDHRAALGVDVACHIGAASRAPLRFFRPGTAGGFGATAAVGKLMGLEPRPWPGHGHGVRADVRHDAGPHRGIHPARAAGRFNASNAVVACDWPLAERRASRASSRGPSATTACSKERTTRRRFAALGQVWRVTELSHKPFPSGRATHGIVDGLLELRAGPPSGSGRSSGSSPRCRPSCTPREPAHRRAAGARRRAAVRGLRGARALLAGTVELEDFRPPRWRTRPPTPWRGGSRYVPTTTPIPMRWARYVRRAPRAAAAPRASWTTCTGARPGP